MTDELISKTDMLKIIDDERFTVDRKFERLRGLKGMSGKWINLEHAKEHFKYISSLDKEQILHILDRLPTATIEPKRGEWIDINGDSTAWKCNQCNAIACCNDNFCPNCGAAMRGEDKTFKKIKSMIDAVFDGAERFLKDGEDNEIDRR